MVERKVGVETIDRSYKVHIDGYNLLPALKGQAEWPRKEFLYWTDDGDIACLRYNNRKVVFMEQRAHGFAVWEEPFVVLRFPKVMNLRADPLERGRSRIHRLWKLAGRAHVCVGPGPDVCGQVPGEFQGIPAAPEARLFQSQCRHGQDQER